MHVTPLTLSGCYLLAPERHEDERGFFARTFCVDELAAAGIEFAIVQQSISFNQQAGTLRGLHWQTEPHAERKLVRVTTGKIIDCLLDLRPESPTYLRHELLELSSENRHTVLIAGGCAHGFLTRTDQTELFYQMDVRYHPASQCGVRYNDPAFGIQWPGEIRIISERDRDYPDYKAGKRS